MPKILDPQRSADYRAVCQCVGGRIREARQRQGMLMSELAQRMERSTSWMSFIELGTNGPNIMDLMALSDILEVPIEFFLSDMEYVSSFQAPKDADEWRMMFPGEPERAAAHESIDKIYRSAQKVLAAQIRAGIGA